MFKRSLVSLWSLVFLTLFLHPLHSYVKHKRPKFQGKIVGGSFTKIRNHPHAVFLSITCANMNMICGGSVVNQDIIVTAGHCLYECSNDFKIDVYAGHENLNQVTVVRHASKYAIHRDYSDDSLANDISLVLLATHLPLDNRIKRVIIKSHHPDRLTCSVAGWGVTNDETRERAMVLKTVQQSLRPPKVCSLVGTLERGMICAGDTKNSDDRPSKGDSGSGLVSPQYQLIGIVSFRTEEYPALLVYTDVSYFIDWITQTSKKLHCSDHH